MQTIALTASTPARASTSWGKPAASTSWGKPQASTSWGRGPLAAI